MATESATAPPTVAPTAQRVQPRPARLGPQRCPPPTLPTPPPLVLSGHAASLTPYESDRLYRAAALHPALFFPAFPAASCLGAPVFPGRFDAQDVAVRLGARGSFLVLKEGAGSAAPDAEAGPPGADVEAAVFVRDAVTAPRPAAPARVSPRRSWLISTW